MPYPNTLLTKKVRRIIMLFWIICFFILSPVIILYTAGYRYNWKKHIVEYTGVISIDVLPADATVKLNNVIIQDKLPLRLTNRAQGTYHLQIEKSGYKTWEQDITVDSRQTTYIKNITLFKEALPLPIDSLNGKKIKAAYPSFDGKYFLFVIDKEKTYDIVLFDAFSRKQTSIIRGSLLENTIVDWSPTNNFAYIRVANAEAASIYLFNAANPDIVKSYKYTESENTNNIQWEKIGTAPLIYTNVNTNILAINTTEDIKKIFPLSATTTIWFVENGKIWTLNQTKNLLTANDNSQTYILPNLGIIKKIIDVNANRAILQTEDAIAIIKYNDQPGIYTSLATNKFVYNYAKKEWLAWSPFELWTIYENGDSVLLNRTGEKIVNVLPLDNYGVLLVSTEKSLTAFNPGYYVSNTLLNEGVFSSVTVNQTKKSIFFFGSIASHEGLFELAY